jgi:hypothetical protein
MVLNLELLQVVAIPTLILILVLNIKMKTIIIDTLPQEIGKSCIYGQIVMFTQVEHA